MPDFYCHSKAQTRFETRQSQSLPFLEGAKAPREKLGIWPVQYENQGSKVWRMMCGGAKTA
jgi:hypothetical protein